MFSGMGFCFILFVVVYVVLVWFVYWYVMKVKKSFLIGIYGKYSIINVNKFLNLDVKLIRKYKWIMVVFFVNYVIFVFGVIKYKWYIIEIVFLFVILIIVIGVIGRLFVENIVKLFINGVVVLVGGVLVIGVFCVVFVVLNEGYIVDFMFY